MIVADTISKYYGDHAALAEVSFTIAAGEVVGLLGLNGAGKSTTLRILSGLTLPTAGAVWVDGVNMAEHPERVRGRIGFLPQNPPLYRAMRVDAFLTFAARIKGYRGRVAQAVEETLQITGLSQWRGEPIARLSYGLQQRVGLAHAIVHQPALLLLDEPSSGLDPVQVVQMRRLIRRLRGSRTIIVSSHNLSEIHEVCDRIFVLHDGQMAAQGTESELARHVAGSVHLAVQVRGPRALFLQTVAALAYVLNHEIVQEEGDMVAAVVELQGDMRAELASALVHAGLGVLRLERDRLQLETIFLKLTESPWRQYPAIAP